MTAELHDVVVYVTLNNSANYVLKTSEQCAVAEGPFQLGETRHVSCTKDLVGRYVVISQPGTKKQITMCEVQVYPRTGRAIMGDNSELVGKS